MPRRPVDVRDYDRDREGQVEHVSEYTRMQDVRGESGAPSMLALGRPSLPVLTQGSGMDAAWERRHFIDTHNPDGTELGPGDSPARPWDRILWGLGEMATEAGLVKSPREGYDEAGRIWHYPTASMDDSYTREMVIRDMERSLGPQFGPTAGRSEEERLEATREALSTERVMGWRIGHAERDIPTKADIDSTVETELDAAIKNDYPGIRRGTKRYKELYEGHRAGAERYYVKAGEAAKVRALAELDRERGEMAEPARRVRDDATYQLKRVAWVEALKPGSEIAARERRIVERQLAMATDYDRHLNGELERVKGLAVGRIGPRPIY